MTATYESVMEKLESLGTERTRKSYLARGVKEPVFGVASGALKPLKKEIGVDQALAEELWDSGNYDAMYLAGMIADVSTMTEEDFDRWMDSAYCPMLSDFVVAVTLAESDHAQAVAQRWVHSAQEHRASAGWACYEWLLGWRPDSYFSADTIRELLDLVAATIHEAAPCVKRAMNGFIVAVGVSYLPLHDEAVQAAERIGVVEVAENGGVKRLGSAVDQIRKAAEKDRLGFKRRAVRC